MAIFSKFFGRTVSEAAGVAAGLAVAAPLRPVVQLVENETWALHPDKPVAVGVAAAIVAEDVEKDAWGVQQASWTGYDEATFRAVLGEALNAPDLGTLYEAWRRSKIGDGDFIHGLRKAKLEPRWDTALKALKTRLLDLEPIAAGIQRGLLPAPFALPFNPQPGGGKIPAFPTANLDPVATTEGLGYTTDDLFLETALAGNPPGPEGLYRAWFRGAIDEADVERGLVEGRSRAEWAPAFEADARAIPSATNFVEAFVRNWIKQPEMIAGTARHGMSPEDTNLLFLIHGRPLTHNQVFIGEQRGGVYDGPTGSIDAHFLKSLQESDMRPEWYHLAWAARYHFPPFFQTINALSKGWIDAATATKWLTYQAYDPEAVDTIVSKVAQPTAAGLSPAVKSAQTKFLTAIHKAFVKGGITDTQMVEQLALSELDTSDQAGVAAFYRKEKALEAIPPPAAA